MSRWSFTQCWGPGLVLDPSGLQRPVLRMLVDEEADRPVAFEAGTSKLKPAELAAWLQAWVLLLQPQELLLDDPALAEAIHRVAPAVSVQMLAHPPALRRGLELIRARFPEPVPFALLELLGPDEMTLFLREAESFSISQASCHVRSRTILQLTAPGRVYGVTLPEAGSLAIFAGVEQAHRGTELPIAAFGPMQPCFVHWDDLNFSDALGIRRTGDRYPGVTLEPGWVTPEVARDLLWLLRALPHATRRSVPLQADGYELRFTGLQARSQAWRRILRWERAA